MKKRLFVRVAMLIAACVMSMTAKAYTVDVVADGSSSGFTYTATLSDGTVLGFSRNSKFNSETGGYEYSFAFSGVITSATSLIIPDSIRLDNALYCIEAFGGDYSRSVLSQAPNVTEVSMPSVTSIGYAAFAGCTSLTTVSMPSVTSIGRSAFSSCTSLTTVSMPSVTSIGYAAFSGCSTLTTVSMPSVTSIDESAFRNCTSLTTVSMPSVTSIGSYAFSECTSLTTISMPSVTSIENSVFAYSTALTTITMPANISMDFSSFTNLENLYLLGETKASWSANNLFYCKKLIVWVDQSIYSSYRDWIYNNGIDVRYEGWQPYTVDLTVSTPGQLGNQVLAQVSQWTDIDALVVKGHIDSRDMRHFASMSCLRTIDLSQTDITTISGCTGLKMLHEISLPETVTAVEENAFDGCIKLMAINLPNVKTIGSNAFRSCSALTTISLPNATRLGGNAFSSCGLTSIELPLVTDIEDSNYGDRYSGAFGGCSSLTSISLPSAITIGEKAFNYCSSLTNIELPVATSIGSDAFYGCYKLPSISLPAAISIGSTAFYYCSSLKTVSLSASLQSLGKGCFNGCDSLQSIYSYLVIPFQTDAFDYSDSYYYKNFPSGVTLHVPAFSVTPYKLHASWGGAFTSIVPIDGETSEVVVNTDFTLTSIEGLATKPNISVMESVANEAQGHLDVQCPQAAVQLGSYIQSKNNYTKSSSSYYTTTSDVATLIANSEMTADQVTVKMSLPTGKWHFITLPFDVNVSDIQAPQGTLWVVRHYSGADRAAMTGNTWQDMTSGSVLQAGEGYIIQCAKENPTTSNGYYYGEVVEFTFPAVDNQQKNNIFTYSDVRKALNLYESEYAYNRSWNLVGNPYPSYMDATKITHSGVITTWNGNGYTAYSLLDDQYVLSPFEAFFVQRGDNVETMTFNAAGRQHTNANTNTNTSPAPRRSQDMRQVFNFTLSDNNYTDRARLVVNPQAKTDYETSCDAAKMMSMNNNTPQLYIVDNGVRYAIDERPVGEGTFQLGLRVSANANYTIALQELSDGQNTVVLTDHQTGIQTDLTNDSYTFTAEAGNTDNRFTVTLGGEVTGISNVNVVKDNEGKWFSLDGKQVKNGATPGVYIMNKNGKSRKVVVTK